MTCLVTDVTHGTRHVMGCCWHMKTRNMWQRVHQYGRTLSRCVRVNVKVFWVDFPSILLITPYLSSGFFLVAKIKISLKICGKHNTLRII